MLKLIMETASSTCHVIQVPTQSSLTGLCFDMLSVGITKHGAIAWLPVRQCIVVRFLDSVKLAVFGIRLVDPSWKNCAATKTL